MYKIVILLLPSPSPPQTVRVHLSIMDINKSHIVEERRVHAGTLLVCRGADRTTARRAVPRNWSRAQFFLSIDRVFFLQNVIIIVAGSRPSRRKAYETRVHDFPSSHGNVTLNLQSNIVFHDQMNSPGVVFIRCCKSARVLGNRKF